MAHQGEFGVISNNEANEDSGKFILTPCGSFKKACVICGQWSEFNTPFTKHADTGVSEEKEWEITIRVEGCDDQAGINGCGGLNVGAQRYELVKYCKVPPTFWGESQPFTTDVKVRIESEDLPKQQTSPLCGDSFNIVALWIDFRYVRTGPLWRTWQDSGANPIRAEFTDADLGSAGGNTDDPCYDSAACESTSGNSDESGTLAQEGASAWVSSAYPNVRTEINLEVSGAAYSTFHVTFKVLGMPIATCREV